MVLVRLLSVIFYALILALSLQAQTPYWIWKNSTAGHEQANFRRTISLEKTPKKASLRMTCDDTFTLSVNGQEIVSSKKWEKPVEIDLTPHLKKGKNHFLVEAQNQKSRAGMLFLLEIDGKRIVSNKQWEAQAHEEDWHQAVEIATYGNQPWGYALNKVRPIHTNKPPTSQSSGENITSLPDFKVEKLHTTQEGEGSWVAIASDHIGRLITASQYGEIHRITLTPKLSVEKLEIDLKSGSQGLLCAFDSLYVMVNDGGSRGLYRLQDTTGDDQYDKEEYLIPFSGGGEHGMHSIILSPDKKSLYLVVGNNGNIPNSVTHHRMSPNWGEDHLLPRMADGRGHNKGRMAPGGFIMKISPDGSSQEVICTGFRNEYDAAFNEDGELFTFDADMEYDIGSPWYRPTRINHVVSGADWGWRNGTGKWPTYYTDSLPPVIDIGPGSPTGVCSGLGAAFPEKYQRAIFTADWTYGTMYAIHLQRDGATYRATKEEFLSGKPLPLTDQIIHTDGNMYFLTGGRRTTSSLFKVSYKGKEPTAPILPVDSVSEELTLRRELETLHLAGVSAETVPMALKHIGHEDRFIRHAARVALEKQSPGHWKAALTDTQNTWAVIELSTALARMGKRADQQKILSALNALDLENLPLPQLLAALRSYQLSFTRLGNPDSSQETIDKLSPLYPHSDNYVTRELAQLLLYLNAPNTISKTVNLVLNSTDIEQKKLLPNEIIQRNDRYGVNVKRTEQFKPNTQQFALAFMLRSIKEGWSEADRASYFSWFPRAFTWQAGNSFPAFLENTRVEALANIPDEALRKKYAESSKKALPPARAITPPKGPGRAWTVDEAVAAVEGNLHGRDYKNGESLYHATSCAICHPLDGQAAALGIGPNLTGSANRYSVKDMMENIIDPSKIISDQYGSTHFTMKDGSSIIGRLGSETDGVAHVMTNPFSPESTLEIQLTDVAERKPFEISPMPAGLINTLNLEELSDLIAFIFSAGDPLHAYFQAPEKTPTSLFNGTTLDGWKGDLQYWSVKDGTIYGSTIGNPTPANTFLILDQAPISDFLLTYEGKCSGNNSGVMYRSEIVNAETFTMKGYQADMHPNPPYLAMLYEEKGRGILIKRGETMTITAEGKKQIHSTSQPSKVDSAQWQQYEIIAEGNRVIHKLNGEVAIDLTDESPMRIKEGHIGLQLHAGAEMETQYRNLQLKVKK